MIHVNLTTVYWGSYWVEWLYLPVLLYITGHIEIIYDTDESLEDTDTEQDQGEEGDQEEKDNSLMLYTFVTVGLLLLLVVIVLVHLVAIMRCLQSRRWDTPLLSEEEQISILKQIDYLNPTYQFIDQSTKGFMNPARRYVPLAVFKSREYFVCVIASFWHINEASVYSSEAFIQGTTVQNILVHYHWWIWYTALN